MLYLNSLLIKLEKLYEDKTFLKKFCTGVSKQLVGIRNIHGEDLEKHIHENIDFSSDSYTHILSKLSESPAYF